MSCARLVCVNSSRNSSLKTRSVLQVTSVVLCNKASSKSVSSTMHRRGNINKQHKLPPPGHDALDPQLSRWTCEMASRHDSLPDDSTSSKCCGHASNCQSTVLLLLAHKRLSVLWLRRIASKAQLAHVNAARMDTAHVSSNVNHHRLAVNSSTHFASVPATPRSGVHSKFAAQASAAADVIVNALALRHNRQTHPAAAPHPGPPALRCMGLEASSWTHHPTSRPVTQCACAPTSRASPNSSVANLSDPLLN